MLVTKEKMDLKKVCDIFIMITEITACFRIIQESARTIAGDMSLNRSKGMRSDKGHKRRIWTLLRPPTVFPRNKWEDKNKGGWWDYMEVFF